MLFYDKAQEYLAKEKENLAPLTVRTYYWNLKKIQYFRPDLECASVDEATIREFRNHMLQQGNKPATVNKALSVFRIFTSKMVTDGLVSGKPFEKIKVGRVFSRRGFDGAGTEESVPELYGPQAVLDRNGTGRDASVSVQLFYGAAL